MGANLGSCLHHFLEDYLPRQRNASPHTIRAYRDSLKLLLVFAAKRRTGSAADLSFLDIDRATVLDFLTSLERERVNGVSTRNLRLTAIRSFFRCTANAAPELVEHCRRIVSIPSKRCDSRAIDYLTVDEIDAILSQVPANTIQGRRHDCLIRFLYNTGARVQEALDVRVCDLRLDRPSHVRLMGKGRKERLCPLWPETATRLRSAIDEGNLLLHQPIFTNRNRKNLTRYGARYILSKYVALAVATCPSLKGKNVHPHVLRHTTAMHLLQSGVDLNTIRCWLGHASVTTTNRYVEIDLEMKRRALEEVNSPDSTSPSSTSSRPDEELLAWLEAL